MNDVLSFDFLHDEWEQSVIEEFLKHLNPDNMRYGFHQLHYVRQHVFPSLINFIGILLH